jgi:hypothetical protein
VASEEESSQNGEEHPLKKRAIIAWLMQMCTKVTADLTQELIQIDLEYRDDVTYKGKSYMRALGVTPSKY